MMLTCTNEPTACSVGIWEQHRRATGNTYSREGVVENMRFAVDHQWFLKQPMKDASADQKDYFRWKRLLEREFGIKHDEKEYWVVPYPISYAQLVFLVTLIRHPIEHDGGKPYLRVYSAVKKHKVNPLALLLLANWQNTMGSNVYPFTDGHGFLRTTYAILPERWTHFRNAEKFPRTPYRHTFLVPDEAIPTLQKVGMHQIFEHLRESKMPLGAWIKMSGNLDKALLPEAVPYIIVKGRPQ